jgi:hypothetical protein
MLISQTFSWPSANWPASSPSAQYAVFQTYPPPVGTPTPLQTVLTTSAELAYDDTVPQVYQIRPTDGTLYGPEVTAFVIGVVQCRAYIRQDVRFAIADQANATGITVNWTDSEINGYIHQGINELSVLFPKDADTTISMLPPSIVNGMSVGTRQYALPTDCYSIRSIEYVDTTGRLHLYLKEKPFRGGESTATTYLGYPKLGIMLQPLAGRFYPGHYDQYEGSLFLDWDPSGDGDYVHIRYAARYPLPTDDATILPVQPEDIELISLYAQMKCWLRVESQDSRLSRWRTRDDGGRRDDLPTVKMSMVIKSLYDQRVNERHELRVRPLRLVRR